MEDAAMNIAPDVDPTCSFTVHVLEQRVFFFFFFCWSKGAAIHSFLPIRYVYVIFRGKIVCTILAFCFLFLPLEEEIRKFGKASKVRSL